MKYVYLTIFAVWLATGAPADDRKWLARATLDLIDAVRVAESRAHGVVVKIQIDHDDGAAIYEVEVLSPGVKRKLKLDGSSGQLLDVSDKRGKDELHHAIMRQGASIVDLVRAAQQQYGGSAYEAEIKLHDGHLVGDVKLDSGGKGHKVRVNHQPTYVHVAPPPSRESTPTSALSVQPAPRAARPLASPLTVKDTARSTDVPKPQGGEQNTDKETALGRAAAPSEPVVKPEILKSAERTLERGAETLEEYGALCKATVPEGLKQRWMVIRALYGFRLSLFRPDLEPEAVTTLKEAKKLNPSIDAPATVCPGSWTLRARVAWSEGDK